MSISGYIYVFADKSGLYKIGRAKNPDKRLHSFTCGNPTIRKVCVISTNDMQRAERRLHDRFAAKRRRGEWFALDTADLKYLHRKGRMNLGPKRIREAPLGRASSTLSSNGRYLQLERVNCGKKGCGKCARGQRHGPYWYLYRPKDKGSGLTSEYIGKVLPKALAKEFGAPE